jgi:peptidoglycan/xylan/chitin deacetylase (PgdA/CDA1 family)
MSAPWVCLMYHDITPAMTTAGGGPERFAVPLDEFRRQLGQLRESGLVGCTLGQALGGVVARPVAITFDDGNAGQYERGFRSLVDAGMRATFFVTTDWVGTPGFASWEQLREMRAGGMEIQAHGRTHRFLAELDAAALEGELRGAKDTLDDKLAQRTEMLALPGGNWPKRSLRHLIGEAGYRVVATSRWGLNRGGTTSGITSVERCTVNGAPGPLLFGRIAAGDASLALRRRMRERTLNSLRAMVGPSTYATWRRRFLDLLRHDPAAGN